MYYIITEVQPDETRTTICSSDNKKEAIDTAKGFYRYERGRLRYIVERVKSELKFGESIIPLEIVWDSDVILPWEDV